MLRSDSAISNRVSLLRGDSLWLFLDSIYHDQLGVDTFSLLQAGLVHIDRAIARLECSSC